jgi:hypothetical protein
LIRIEGRQNQRRNFQSYVPLPKEILRFPYNPVKPVLPFQDLLQKPAAGFRQLLIPVSLKGGFVKFEFDKLAHF